MSSSTKESTMEMESESRLKGHGSRKSRRTTSVKEVSLKPPEMVVEEGVRRRADFCFFVFRFQNLSRE